MKLLYWRSGLVSGLLLAGLVSVAAAQDATESHDLQFIANNGSPRMIAQTKAGVISTSSNVFVQLTAGSITIPAGQSGFLLSTFSGESNCSGTPGGWCALRVTVNGAESNPIVGANFAFDSMSSSGDLWESHSIQRISNRLPAGTYSVQVEWAVVGTGTFNIDDWLLQVEYLRAN
jgi:hypothetical protein